MVMTLIFYNLWLVGKQVSLLCRFSSSALLFSGEKYPDKSHWPIYLSLLIFLSCKTHTNELQSCPFQLHSKCWFNILVSFDAHVYGTIYFSLISISWNYLKIFCTNHDISHHFWYFTLAQNLLMSTHVFYWIIWPGHITIYNQRDKEWT